MFSKVKFRKYNNYSGPLIYGKTKMETPPKCMNGADNFFWQRILWLIAQVEVGGRYGTVVGYDGTGITASVIQMVAVYPYLISSGLQGPLWSLVEKIRDFDESITENLDEELSNCNWHLKDSYVRRISDNVPIKPFVLRNELTPNDGKIIKGSSNWDHAKQWALIFNEIFSNNKAFKIQDREAISFIKNIALRKNSKLNGSSVIETLTQEENNSGIDTILCRDSTSHLLIATVISFMINCPSLTIKIISDYSLNNWGSHKNTKALCNLIMKNLQYIRPNRYHRTRIAAKKLWPAKQFRIDGLMPSKF
jgi:hypothetical protein